LRHSGELEVKWDLRENNGDSRVRLEWRESNVPLPKGPAASGRKGYGRELIERALPYQLDAVTNFELAADGVRCSVEIPLERAK